MKVQVITAKASNFDGEKRLQQRFIDKLQDIVNNGGAIISIVNDDIRYKKAYVLTNDNEELKP